MDQTVDAQRRTYQNAELLEGFWLRANQAQSRRGRLMLLRGMAALKLAPDPYVEHSTSRGRHTFQKQKSRGQYRLQGWCWICRNETPDHRHHILPLKNGGRNRKANIVNLCEDCHRDVHSAEAKHGV